MPRIAPVSIVGAGPGDPDLLTVKARRVLERADVVVHDRLVSAAVLDLVPRAAERVFVGKAASNHSMSQDEINALLVDRARGGRRVVRLKGGDPFVFGRGAEEVQALAAEGIEVEVIPGITAGIGAPAALGIPVTHRDVARGVTFISGHTKDGQEPNWQALARSGTTLVVYMGLSRIEKIVSELRKAGLSDATPACAIENGTLKTQREVISTLGGLQKDVAEKELASPVLIVIGDVVRFARASVAVPKSRAA